jgi:hypothetical protein
MGIDYRIGHCATSLQNAGMKTSAGFAVYLLAGQANGVSE